MDRECTSPVHDLPDDARSWHSGFGFAGGSSDRGRLWPEPPQAEDHQACKKEQRKEKEVEEGAEERKEGLEISEHCQRAWFVVYLQNFASVCMSMFWPVLL